MPRSDLLQPLLDWYAVHARDLPWRAADASAWSVLVSEFMLQQTPVSRVLPVHAAWLQTWPSPSALADAPAGEAIRAWGRLGYPRRALRLHAAATALRDRHDDAVPSEYDDLLALPGVGDYTAAAVATFAFGRRHVVLDTNVRRVLTRTLVGAQFPAAATTAADRRLGASVLPDDDRDASRWSVATMELGALVCTARVPECHRCPVRDRCAWRLAGFPAHDGPPRRGQTYAGADRQCRGRLLGVLRSSQGPVHRSLLKQAWDDEPQRERALDGLVADGLVEPLAGHRFTLPGTDSSAVTRSVNTE